MSSCKKLVSVRLFVIRKAAEAAAAQVGAALSLQQSGRNRSDELHMGQHLNSTYTHMGWLKLLVWFCKQ